MPLLQRKYVDLIREVSSKWVNWDPPIPIEVGAFGDMVTETGELVVGGNIYHPAFQSELDRLRIDLRIADHPPQQGPVEDDFVIASKGARRSDLHVTPQAGFAGIATASIQGQWQFDHGRRDALLVMRSPRQRFLPRDVLLDALYRVPALKDKWLVTSVHVCPAFSMYLSNKSGEKLSLALLAQAPLPAPAGVTAGLDTGLAWWSDVQADLLRKACDTSGNFSYTPLYALKRRVGWFKRRFREDEQALAPDSRDALWVDVTPPWDPLDEDGEEDAIHVDQDQDGDESDD